MESKKAPEQIRIKTLEEIRQEKAAKCQSQNDGSSVVAPENTKTITTKGTKGVKRAITIQDEKNRSPKKVRQAVEKIPCKSQGESNTAGPVSEAANVEEVRVKTLEEIRREKAARMQTQEAENKRNSEILENGAKKPRILRINKLASQSKTVLSFLVPCMLFSFRFKIFISLSI